MNKDIKAARQLTEILDYLSNYGKDAKTDKVLAMIQEIETVGIECDDSFFAKNAIESKFKDAQALDQGEIEKLNTILPWSTVMSFRGEFQGSPWDARKRASVFWLPDSHIIKLKDLISDGRVLEVGCHEGVFTLGLLMEAKKVVALDGRIENVAKTLMRVWLANALDRADGVCYDLEKLRVPELSPLDADGYGFELLHHNGVLYHLSDPLGHLDNVLESNPTKAIFLDTHVAREEQCNDTYESAGKTYSVFNYKEPAIRTIAPFAGITPLARWLRFDDLKSYLVEKGFTNFITEELRVERNGLRTRIVCTK